MANNQRNLNIEAYRIFLMMLIIALHVTEEFFCLPKLLENHRTFDSVSFFFIRSFLFVGVSGFAFISSYYGVKWSLSKALKFELTALSLGTFLVLLKFLICGTINFNEVSFLATPFTSQVCWYFSAYVLLMAVSPLINIGIEKLDKRTFSIILAVMLAYLYVGNFIHHRNGTTFVLLFFIYILGQYIKKYAHSFWEKKAVVLFIISILSNGALSGSAIFFGHANLLAYLSNNNNPLLIIAAISLFFIVKKRETTGFCSTIVAKMAPYMFSVYIFHVEFFYLKIFDFSFIDAKSYIVVPLATLSIFFISTFFCWIREKLFGNIEEKLLKKVDSRI